LDRQFLSDFGCAGPVQAAQSKTCEFALTLANSTNIEQHEKARRVALPRAAPVGRLGSGAGADQLYRLRDFTRRREKSCFETAEVIAGNRVEEVIEPEGGAFELAE
jgi:hypothetical protein